jgi:hypothetical protein
MHSPHPLNHRTPSDETSVANDDFPSMWIEVGTILDNDIFTKT